MSPPATTTTTAATIRFVTLNIATLAIIFPPMLGASTSASAEEHNSYRVEQNHRVQHRRLVLDVVQLVLELFHRVFNRGPVWITELRPTRETGLYQMPL